MRQMAMRSMRYCWKCRRQRLQPLRLSAKTLSTRNPRPEPVSLGIPFSIGTDEASTRFQQFCSEKGVTGGLAVSNVLSGRHYASFETVTPFFAPFWSFDCTIRVRLKGGIILRQLRRGYEENVIYGGYTYHRGLLRELPSVTSLGAARPFTPALLDSRVVGRRTEADPWSLYQGSAWRLVREDIAESERSAALEGRAALAGPQDVEVKFFLHGVRRYYIPAYAFEYNFFGQSFHVFVSGAPKLGVGAAACGIDHGSLINDLSSGLTELQQIATEKLRRVASWGVPLAGTMVPRFVVQAALGVTQAALRFSVMLVQRVPLFWPAALAGFVAFRKIFMPLRARNLSYEEWTHQLREEEDRQTREGDSWTWADEFDHTTGYTQSGWQRQQQQQDRAQTPPRQRTAATYDFEDWPPEKVLGVSAFASKSEVQAAFRREMLKWHPDHQRGKTDSERSYALARSQAVTVAYAKLRGRG